MKTVFLSVVATLSLAVATAAQADPIKVESENIIFYGDASPKLGKQVVEKMEIYRKLIMTLSGIDPQPDKQKLTIYAFDDVPDLAKFAGMRGVAGVYTQGFDGPLMITPLKGALDQDSFNNQVALHEYSHHILHGYMDRAFPRWYDEGFANFLSTFTLEDGTIQLGRAAAKHARGLMRGGPKWVDIEDVIGAIRVYPFADRGSKRGILLNQFYAQSWLYVHYLYSNKELNMRLGDYLDRLDAGEEPISAFENGFGITTKEFHKAAKRYFKDDEFIVQQFQPPAEFLTIPMSVKRISKPELDLQMALGQRSFLSKRTLNAYAKKLNSYETKVGQTPQSLAARASYFINKEDYEKAEQYAMGALGQDRNSVEALRMVGDTFFHKSHAEEFKDLEDTEPRIFMLNEDMKKSISYFEMALAQSPTDYTSVTHMISIYGSSDIPLTSAARASAKIFERTYWKPDNITGSLDLANIHRKDGKIASACNYFETASQQAKTAENSDKSPLTNRVKLMAEKFKSFCAVS